MAGDAAFTRLLLAMGLRSFSMHPSRISSIKQRVLRADTRALRQHLQEVLASGQIGRPVFLESHFDRFRPEVREFYQLEKMWLPGSAHRGA